MIMYDEVTDADRQVQIIALLREMLEELQYANRTLDRIQNAVEETAQNTNDR